ncbi:MAG: CBS domain-containing protein [Chitinophagaceae bacterium]
MITVKNILEAKAPAANTIDAGATVFDALKKLSEVDLSYLVVKEGDTFKGVFSERDYSRNVALKGRSSRDTAVGDVMASGLPQVAVTDMLQHCIENLLQAKTRYLLAFDNQSFAGVITIHDLLRQVLASKGAGFDSAAAQQLIDYDEKGLVY